MSFQSFQDFFLNQENEQSNTNSSNDGLFYKPPILCDEDKKNGSSNDDQEKLEAESHFEEFIYQPPGIQREKVVRKQKKLQNSELVKQVVQRKKFHWQKKEVVVKRTFDFLFASKAFSSNSKFYLFADSFIDVEYVRSLGDNSLQDYVDKRKGTSIYVNMKFIDSIVLQKDPCFVEVHSEIMANSIQDIQTISHMFKSISNTYVAEFMNQLETFWKGILILRQKMLMFKSSSFFTEHYTKRRIASEIKCQSIIKEFDPSKLIMYVMYRADFQKLSNESSFSGYSRKLCEFLAGDIESFQSHLKNKGYIDPIFIQNKMEIGFKYISNYVNNQRGSQSEEEKKKELIKIPLQNTKIATIDGYVFPVVQQIRTLNLDTDYDLENSLNYPFHDVLIVYNYTLLDESLFEQLQAIRMSNSAVQKYTASAIENTDFLRKYYSDDLQNTGLNARW